MKNDCLKSTEKCIPVLTVIQSKTKLKSFITFMVYVIQLLYMYFVYGFKLSDLFVLEVTLPEWVEQKSLHLVLQAPGESNLRPLDTRAMIVLQRSINNTNLCIGSKIPR